MTRPRTPDGEEDAVSRNAYSEARSGERSLPPPPGSDRRAPPEPPRPRRGNSNTPAGHSEHDHTSRRHEGFGGGRGLPSIRSIGGFPEQRDIIEDVYYDYPAAHTHPPGFHGSGGNTSLRGARVVMNAGGPAGGRPHEPAPSGILSWITSGGSSYYSTPSSGRGPAVREQALVHEIERLQGENRGIHAAHDEATRELERRYEDKIREMEAALDEQTRLIEITQQATMAILEQGRSHASSDSDVIKWFRLRGKSWGQWAKQFGHKEFGRIRELSDKPEQRQEFLTAVGKFVALLPDNSLPEGLREGLREDRLPPILLHGMLANFICSEAFSSPFWVLGAVTEESCRQPNAESEPVTTGREAAFGATANPKPQTLPTGTFKDCLSTLYTFLTDIQEKDAHSWRSQMMRIFATNGISDGEAEESGNRARLNRWRCEHTKNLTNAFVTGAARVLFKDLEEDAARDRNRMLEDEINAALQYSARLWSHRSFVRCVDLGYLKHHALYCFEAGRDLYEPHSSAGVDEPAECEGRQILAVIQPGIVAVGTEEGQGYADITRTWMKAQVMLRQPASRSALADPNQAH